MAQQAANPADITGSSYAERRTPQFVGGNADPNTGNLIQATRQTAAQPQVTSTSRTAAPIGDTLAARPADTASGGTPPTSAYALPTPAASNTRLGDFSADTGASAPNVSTGQALGAAAVGLGGAIAAPTLGANIGSQIGGGVPFGEAIGNTLGKAGDLFTGATGAVEKGLGATVGEFGPEAAGTFSGSALGGAAGAGVLSGIGTLAGGLIGGEKLSDVAPKAAGSAIGSGIGFAIGNVLLPGLGGIIGSTLGSMGGSYLASTIFCHAAGTLIRMADGSLKKIEELAIGDETWLGGEVLGHGQVLAADIFEYRGTRLNGNHAVFEDGRWLRVKDSEFAKPVVLFGPVKVYPVVTANHLLVCEQYICADLAEWNEDIGADGRLAKLNECAERNKTLGVCTFLHFEHSHTSEQVDRVYDPQLAA